jgi:hypothetical protein
VRAHVTRGAIGREYFINARRLIMGACLSSDNKGHLQVDDSVRFFISLSLEGKI